jgi:hypothetical protein
LVILALRTFNSHRQLLWFPIPNRYHEKGNTGTVAATLSRGKMRNMIYFLMLLNVAETWG